MPGTCHDAETQLCTKQQGVCSHGAHITVGKTGSKQTNKCRVILKSEGLEGNVGIIQVNEIDGRERHPWTKAEVCASTLRHGDPFEDSKTPGTAGILSVR